MIIMLHSINRAKGEGPEALTAVLFSRMMEELHDQDFQAIDVQDLAAFLEDNSRIPARSVVLLQDQSRYPGNFDTHFRTYWDKWGWPVVNAWDAQASVTDALWEDYAALSTEGLVDFQVYGPTLSVLAKPKPEQQMLEQLEKPIKILEDKLGATPIGVIWPSGFTEQSVRVARELGYRVGFTFNSRGPVMYNWIPLSDTVDRLRPSYQPESPVGDPLMTLPRFWPHQVHTALDAVRITGKEAAAHATQNKSIEMNYYEIVCAGKYGPIPSP